jgi:flavin-dependent dehydrogenase
MEPGLVDGSRVCIIGGGPAGSLSALHLLNFARQKGIWLDVTIFEPRDHTALGSRGCKGCAGILSTRLLNGLASIDISPPKEVIQSELHSYSIHVDGDIIQINQPDARRRIVSVFRGGGPHHYPADPPASFDRYLLFQACAHGARLVQGCVKQVVNGERLVVSTSRESYTADLVVLATGVSSNNPLPPTFGYRGPPTEIMVQDEVLRPDDWPSDEIKVYLKQPAGMIFGVLTPKGRCLNVSLLGHRLTQDAVIKFIDSVEIGPDHQSLVGLCGCSPHIAVGPAKNIFGDRWVAVGDAAATRLYKDGIGSAFFTAKKAMQVAISEGVSRRAFRRGYYPYCKSIAADNAYGQLLYRLWEMTVKTPFLLETWKRAVRSEMEFPPEQRIHMRILWGMLTGDEPYKDLAFLFLKRPAMRGLLYGLRQTA